MERRSAPFLRRSRDRNTRRGFLCLPLLLLFFLAPDASSQSFRLFLDYLDASAWPDIRIALHVDDNAVRLTDLSSANFVVTENGRNQFPLYLDCTLDSARTPVSFMLVMDKSLSMVRREDDPNVDDPDSTKLRAARRMFSDFVHNLRPADEAALLTFCSVVQLERAFTNDTSDLLESIYRVRVCSGTAIYDAIVQGVQQVSTRPGRRVIILMTDGNDNSSRNSISWAISQAVTQQIPVYCIGVGADVNSALLRMIAQQTGGEYFFAPNAAELAMMYDKIAVSIFSGVCQLRYASNNRCPDGALRNVDISFLRNNQSVSRTVAYFAPLVPDSASFTVEPPSSWPAGKEVLIPVYLHGRLDAGDSLAWSVEYLFDNTLLQWIGIEQQGTLSENLTINLTTGSDRFRIDFPWVPVVKAYPQGSAIPLFYARFRTAAVKSIRDAVLTPVEHRLVKSCSVTSRITGASIRIEGCPENLRIEMDSSIFVRQGTTLIVPVRLTGGIDPLQPLEFILTFQFDPALMEFTGFNQHQSICPHHLLSVAIPAAGSIRITAMPALPADSAGILFQLVFRIRERTESVIGGLKIGSAELKQSCIPTLSYNGMVILVDGACGRLAAPKGTPALFQNVPNPANPSTTITFIVAGGDRVTLELYDTHGRHVATLVDGVLAPGTHRVQFTPAGLASGLYFYRLTEANRSLVRGMVIAK